MTVSGRLRGGAYRTWRSLWLPISRSPRWFPLLVTVQRRGLAPCHADHDLVIEGFPRSGNTFATQAFLAANPDASVSHHMHTPANVLRALEFGVPALVVVRTPADAVLSEVIREPRKSVAQALREWLSFYETVRPHLDAVVVAPFDQVTTSYDKVIAALNATCGTDFNAYVNSATADAAVLAGIDERARGRGKSGTTLETQVPRPSKAREQRKQEIVAQLQERTARRLLVRAEALYAELVDDTR